jgi:hypothetical protein
LPAGESRVEVMFVRTWDRTAGALISVLSVLGVGLFWGFLKSKPAREVAL